MVICCRVLYMKEGAAMAGNTPQYKCPVCGFIAGEYDFDIEEDENYIPYGCAACGGPWPDCMTGCTIYEN